jgi:hypothetical protein
MLCAFKKPLTDPRFGTRCGGGERLVAAGVLKWSGVGLWLILGARDRQNNVYDVSSPFKKVWRVLFVYEDTTIADGYFVRLSRIKYDEREAEVPGHPCLQLCSAVRGKLTFVQPQRDEHVPVNMTSPHRDGLFALTYTHL